MGVDLKDLQEMMDAATPAPWCVHPNGTSVWSGVSYDSSGNDVSCRHIFNSTGYLPGSLADVLLVVELRNAAPFLLAELRLLRARCDALKEFVDQHKGVIELLRKQLQHAVDSVNDIDEWAIDAGEALDVSGTSEEEWAQELKRLEVEHGSSE